MAGVGRGARQGRRPSSSSPFFSTATMLVVIAFCILAVWIISPASFFPSSSTSSRMGNEPALRSREYLASPFSERSPTFVYKDNDDGGDAEGGGGGGREMGAEDVQEVAEEKLPAPIVQKVDLGAEEDSGSGVKEKEAAGESQEEEHQQEQGGLEEDSQREQLIDPGAAANELEQSREAGSEREELPNHAAAGDENGGDGQVQPHPEEAVERSSVQLEDEGLIEIQQQNKDGEGSEQLQQPPEQQEAENTGDDGLQIQQQQESEEGGSGENVFNSDQDQKDAGTTEEEGEGADGKEESQRQVEQEGNSAIHSTASMQEAEEGIKDSGDQPSQQAHDEKLSDEPHVGDSSKYGSRQEGDSTPWSTQADQSQDEKERRAESQSQIEGEPEIGTGDIVGHHWRLCNATAGPDYIPCLDNEEFLRHPHSTKHFEHRERHCPEDAPICLVPLPKGYRLSIEWPKSRNKIWYNNVPHTKLAVVKGHQNWVKVTGEYLTFPGGGTQFIHGALHYIEFLQKSVRNIAWGKHTRTVLDVGCGVASFGGYMFEKDVLTMSFAPKDEHEAQVQFALERGIPAISAVMGSQRLPFPSKAFDLVHCARCRVPWHAEGGRLLLELNRVLRPGGYFVWSATPVYQKLKEDVEIWKEMTSLTKAMCWGLVTIRKDRLNGIGAAIYQKPTSNECYDNRRQQVPPMCDDEDDPDSAWYVPLLSCMHRAPTEPSERGSRWPQEWPRRLRLPPYWSNSSEVGTYGKPAPDDFLADYEHWKRVISKSYLRGLSIDWSKVRNVMDMKAIYGGFAAALKDMKIWVMNVVNVDSPDTLPIIYERGLFGIYHDWCESFSTYPRTYDLLHADQLFAKLKKRCNIVPVVVEVDRISRPGGKLILRDEPKVVSEIQSILKSLRWEVRLKFTKGREGVLYAEKSDWRPETSLSSL